MTKAGVQAKKGGQVGRPRQDMVVRGALRMGRGKGRASQAVGVECAMMQGKERSWTNVCHGH